MPYQKVKTPRFYIDTPSYLNSLGIEYGQGYNKGLFGLNPTNQILIEESPVLYEIDIKLPTKIKNLFDTNKTYFGFLNHSISPKFPDYDNFLMNLSGDFSNVESVINLESVNSEASTPIDFGFSLCTCEINLYNLDAFRIRQITYLDKLDNPKPLYMGNLTFGSYYDMPVSPDLSLSMDIEYDGFKNLKTLNGSTITQSNYQGSPWWYDKDGNKIEPWAIGESEGMFKRNGRRIWNLQFSYINDKDLFSSNYSPSNYLESPDGYEYDWAVDSSDVLDLDFTSSTGWIGSININTSAGTATMGTSGSAQYVFSLSGGAHSSDDFPAGKSYLITIDFGTITGAALFSLKMGSDIKIENRAVNSNSILKTYVTLNDPSVNQLSLLATLPQTFEDASIVINSIKITRTNAINFDKHIDNDDSFSSQVLNKISNGEKFIFQADNTANNPSDFAICVLDKDSFSMQRVAPNTYNINMRIKEVW